MLYINNIDELEERLTEPKVCLVENFAEIEGGILILGAGGKMGPSLFVPAKRALSKTGNSSRVIGGYGIAEPVFREPVIR